MQEANEKNILIHSGSKYKTYLSNLSRSKMLVILVDLTCFSQNNPTQIRNKSYIEDQNHLLK